MRFFSTHIAAGEFDPTEDVVPQLEALNVCKPSPIPDFDALLKFIEEQIRRATRRDDTLRDQGALQPTATVREALLQFLKQLGRCAITGCPLSVIKLLFSTMSLDAIIPGQPHSADNIQWVCVRLNLGKWQWSDEEKQRWRSFSASNWETTSSVGSNSPAAMCVEKNRIMHGCESLRVLPASMLPAAVQT